MRVVFLTALLCLGMASVVPPKGPNCKYVGLKNTTMYALAGQAKSVEVLGKNGCTKTCKCNKKIVKDGFLGLGRKTIGELKCSSCKGGRCYYVDADGSVKSVSTGMSYKDGCNTCKCLENGGVCTKKSCPLTCTYTDWNGLKKTVQAGQNMTLNVLAENGGCLKKCLCVKKIVQSGFLGLGRSAIARLNCEERCYTKGNKGDKRKKRKEKRKEKKKKRKGDKKKKRKEDKKKKRMEKKKKRKEERKKRKGKKRRGKKSGGDQKKD